MWRRGWIWEMGFTWRMLESFYYLGDILNGSGGVNSASMTRAHCAWRKFKELSGILTGKEVLLKGELYVTCVRSAMVYGNET